MARAKTAGDKRDELLKLIRTVASRSTSGEVALYPNQFKTLKVSPGERLNGVVLVEHKE